MKFNVNTIEKRKSVAPANVRIIKKRRNVHPVSIGCQAIPTDIDDELEKLTVRRTPLEIYQFQRMAGKKSKYQQLFIGAGCDRENLSDENLLTSYSFGQSNDGL